MALTLDDRRHFLVHHLDRLRSFTDCNPAHRFWRMLVNPTQDAWFWYLVAVAPGDLTKISYPVDENAPHLESGRRFSSVAKFLRTRAKRHGLDMCEEDIQFLAQEVSLNFPRKVGYTFEVVTGDDIIDAYRDGPHSCMSGADSEYTALYAANPRKVALVKIYENDHYMGRALLWTTDCGTKVLDRIYPGSDCEPHRAALHAHAEQQGWDYRSSRPSVDGYFNKGDRSGYSVTLDNTVSVYPYIDTFRYTDDDPECDDRITLRADGGSFIFSETDGMYDGSSRYTCCHCGDRVRPERCYHEDDSCYCPRCHSNNFVYLEYRCNGRYVEGSYRRDEVSECECCNEQRHDDDLTDIQGRNICGICVENECAFCDGCEELFETCNLVFSVSGRHACCEDCAVPCEDCGSLMVPQADCAKCCAVPKEQLSFSLVLFSAEDSGLMLTPVREEVYA